jgi:hypothetical protein
MLPDPRGDLHGIELSPGRWVLIGGPDEEVVRKLLRDQFESLARLAGITAGVPNRSSALDGWLNLLKAESPYCTRSLTGNPIMNLCLASAQDCEKRAARAFELEKAAESDEGPLGLRRDRYSTSYWLYDHPHNPMADPGSELDYWTSHIWECFRGLIDDYAKIVENDKRKGGALWADRGERLNEAVTKLSYDLAVLQANYVLDLGLRGEDAMQTFRDEGLRLLNLVKSAWRTSSEALALSSGDEHEDPRRSAQAFHRVSDDLQQLLRNRATADVADGSEIVPATPKLNVELIGKWMDEEGYVNDTLATSLQVSARTVSSIRNNGKYHGRDAVTKLANVMERDVEELYLL